MRVVLYGTRGSLPSPGPETNRYGGNTSCVLVAAPEGQVLILDAGSGVRIAGAQIPAGTKRVDILLTHLHMDHIQGLGFFGPLYTPGVEVHIWGPPSTTRSLRSRLTRYLSPPLFPVRMRDMPSALRCHDVVQNTWDIGPFRVESELVCHPDPTLGYRITWNRRSMAYLPDHEPQLGTFPPRLNRAEWLSGFNLAEGVDLLLHDAQYTEEEYHSRIGWGHCTPRLATRFAETVGARQLVFFHHDPSRSDDEVERICEEARRAHTGDIKMRAAAEFDVIKL